ncbi:hypothetical protein A9308_08950 [Moraxella atlantae]|uniref:Uncharacterized protein n=1 Tax=Faucicola atlantae TaxID=34059 RepID=A0A1B8QAD7_9GAMM|nr:hypothetical protein [Moraxella atlantae]OBX76253.1 hypothetical protein A9308_08950 [Moraxella atlantae]
MAEKDKIPQIAIERIIQLRNDKFHNYGYKDIAEKLAEELDIHVTAQAVGYQYKKNKDLVVLTETTKLLHNDEPTTSSIRGSEPEKIGKAIFERKENVKKSLTKDKDFDMSFVEDLSSEDLDKLLKGE